MTSPNKLAATAREWMKIPRTPTSRVVFYGMVAAHLDRLSRIDDATPEEAKRIAAIYAQWQWSEENFDPNKPTDQMESDVRTLLSVVGRMAGEIQELRKEAVDSCEEGLTIIETAKKYRAEVERLSGENEKLKRGIFLYRLSHESNDHESQLSRRGWERYHGHLVGPDDGRS